MITPLWRDGLILWTDTRLAPHFESFLCWGDHGYYCSVKFESGF